VPGVIPENNLAKERVLTKDKENDFSAIKKADSLIKKLDSVLDFCGVVSVTQATATKNAKSKDGLLEILAKYFQAQSFIKLEAQYDKVIELFAEYIAIIDGEPEFSNIEFPDFPAIEHDNTRNLQNIISYMALSKNLLQPLIDNFEGSGKRNYLLSVIEDKKRNLNKGFFYEFTDGDLNRAQELINELRNEITKSDLFEEEHRQRLLRRLERLQGELHKKMGDVDRIWGLVGDAGVVIGKFGKDAKPFVDRIKELSQIAWRTQSHKEELPSGAHNPMLGVDEEGERV
jgi:hypothetical protein